MPLRGVKRKVIFLRADARFFAVSFIFVYGVIQQYRHVVAANVRFLCDCIGEMGMPIRLHSIVRIIVVNAITGSGADMSNDQTIGLNIRWLGGYRRAIRSIPRVDFAYELPDSGHSKA